MQPHIIVYSAFTILTTIFINGSACQSLNERDCGAIFFALSSLLYRENIVCCALCTICVILVFLPALLIHEGSAFQCLCLLDDLLEPTVAAAVTFLAQSAALLHKLNDNWTEFIQHFSGHTGTQSALHWSWI